MSVIDNGVPIEKLDRFIDSLAGVAQDANREMLKAATAILQLNPENATWELAQEYVDGFGQVKTFETIYETLVFVIEKLSDIVNTHEASQINWPETLL